MAREFWPVAIEDVDLLYKANCFYAECRFHEALATYLLAKILRPGLNAGLAFSMDRCIQQLLSDHTPWNQRLRFDDPPEPLVSVLVPMHEQVHATLACLCAIARNCGSVPIQTLILDDASSSQTRQILERIEGLTLVSREQNAGFLLNCNDGSKYANGR